MASILYTHGDTHEINGIICKQEFVPAESVHVLLGAGYFASPEDLAQSLMDAQEETQEDVESVDVEPETDDNEAEEVEEVEETETSEADDEQELESLKARAKELGLKGYGNCGIEALRAKIKEAEEKQEG